MLLKMSNLLVARIFEENRRVYDMGDISGEMFIIRSGSVIEQVPVNNGGWFDFREFHQGDWFG